MFLVNPFISFPEVFGTPDFESATIDNLTSGYFAAAHGLGQKPELVVAEMECLVANNGYSVGDVVVWHNALIDNFTGGVGMGDDAIGATNTECFISMAFRRYDAVAKGGSSRFGFFQNNDWGVRFKAWLRAPDFQTADIAVPAFDNVTSAAHGLGSGIFYVAGEYVCTTAEDNWRVGDTIQMQNSVVFNSGNASGQNRGHNIGYDDTNVFILQAAGNYLNRTTGENAGAPNDANWEYRLKVWKLPAANATSSLIPAVNASQHSFTHGLSNVDFMLSELVCNTVDANWQPGDRIPYIPVIWDSAGGNPGTFRGAAGGYDSTIVHLSTSSDEQVLLDKVNVNANTFNEINYNNWDVQFSVWGS